MKKIEDPYTNKSSHYKSTHLGHLVSSYLCLFLHPVGHHRPHRREIFFSFPNKTKEQRLLSLLQPRVWVVSDSFLVCISCHDKSNLNIAARGHEYRVGVPSSGLLASITPDESELDNWHTMLIFPPKCITCGHLPGPVKLPSYFFALRLRTEWRTPFTGAIEKATTSSHFTTSISTALGRVSKIQIFQSPLIVNLGDITNFLFVLLCGWGECGCFRCFAHKGKLRGYDKAEHNNTWMLSYE